MNAPSWTPWIGTVGIVSLLTLGASFVNAQTTNSNNLTVLGYVDATNEIFYGNAVSGGNTNSAISLNYSDALHEVGLLSSQPSSIFIWQDNGVSSTPSNKMKLDGSNNLTLYSTNGSNGIVLNPTTGGLQLKGTGAGITLVDGTVLANSNSIKSWAEDTNGNVTIVDSTTAIGSNASASGSGSVAMGSQVTAIGPDATAIGNNSTANGSGAIALGLISAATGEGAAALGVCSVANGEGATAIGGWSSATGEGATALGVASSASVAMATALGGWTTASGSGATAAGAATVASGNYSTALSYRTSAKSYISTAFGYNNVGLVSTNGGSTNWVPTDPLLEVGNGTNNASDAVTVFKNGNLRASGAIESPTGVRIPQTGDMNMGSFTNGNSPALLAGTNGLTYPGGN